MIDSEDEARLYKTVADSLSESVRKYRISLVVNNGDVTSQPTL